MKTFTQFCSEAYDKDVIGSSQITRAGEGGRVDPRTRKKSTPEVRRTKRLTGGQSRPSSYKPRADIGTQKSTSDRVQQPTQERGSAALSPKEAQRKAYLERKAREAGGAAKPKELEKQATKLLAKKAAPKAKAPAKDERFSSSRKPEEHMVKGKYTKAEKKTMVRAGKQKLRDLVLQSTGKKKESELKNRYTGPDK
jgi:hypothetical protein